jgi:hypothetical protein
MGHFASSELYIQKYHWSAKYADGKIFTSKDINFIYLDRPGLRQFSIVDFTADSNVFTVILSAGDRIAYRTRTIMQEGVNVIDRIHIVAHSRSDVFSSAFFIYEIFNNIEYAYFSDIGNYHSPVYTDSDYSVV